MVSISAGDFATDPEMFMGRADGEPIAITLGGVTAAYIVTPGDFEGFQHFKEYAPRAYTLEDLPERMIDAIMTSSMSPEHDHLNSLLDD